MVSLSNHKARTPGPIALVLRQAQDEVDLRPPQSGQNFCTSEGTNLSTTGFILPMSLLG